MLERVGEGRAGVIAVAACALWFALLGEGVAQAQGEQEAGLFGGFELAVARASIEPLSTDDAPELGALVGARAGYRFGSGLALSFGFSGSTFDYASDREGVGLEHELALDLVDLSAWYFLGLGEGVELYVRGGAGRAFGAFSTTLRDPSSLGALAGAGQGLGGLGGLGSTSLAEDERGFGAVLSAGLSFRTRGALRTFVEAHGRFLGLSFEAEGLDEDLSTLGLSVGIGWGP